jgi:hypothetical protein
MCREKEGVNICVKKLMLYLVIASDFQMELIVGAAALMLLINNISQVVPFLLHGSLVSSQCAFEWPFLE